MRFGLLGDIHGEILLLRHALACFAAEGVDRVLCVGDIVDGVSDEAVAACCALLNERDVLCVCGNHERWFLEGAGGTGRRRTQALPEDVVSWLRTLPTSRILETALGDLMLCHGIGRDDMAELRKDTRGYGLKLIEELFELMDDPRIKLVVGGHTHEPMVRAFAGLTVVNAGTLRADHGPCCSILDLSSRSVIWFALSAEGAAQQTTQALPLRAPAG